MSHEELLLLLLLKLFATATTEQQTLRVNDSNKIVNPCSRLSTARQLYHPAVIKRRHLANDTVTFREFRPTGSSSSRKQETHTKPT